MKFLILLLFFLFIITSHASHHIYGFRIIKSFEIDNSTNTEILQEKEIYVFPPDHFPLIVCIDESQSAVFKKLVQEATMVWNRGYSEAVNIYLGHKILSHEDIGKIVPGKKQNDEHGGYWWNRNLFFVMDQCTSDFKDDYFHIYVTKDKLKKNKRGGSMKMEYIKILGLTFDLSRIIITLKQDHYWNYQSVYKYNQKTIDNQYTIVTTMMHELGHALGIPHYTNDKSNPFMNPRACGYEKICKPSWEDMSYFLKLYLPHLTYQPEFYSNVKCRKTPSGETCVGH